MKEYVFPIDSYLIDFRLIGNILQLLNLVLWEFYCENTVVKKPNKNKEVERLGTI